MLTDTGRTVGRTGGFSTFLFPCLLLHTLFFLLIYLLYCYGVGWSVQHHCIISPAFGLLFGYSSGGRSPKGGGGCERGEERGSTVSCLYRPTICLRCLYSSIPCVYSFLSRKPNHHDSVLDLSRWAWCDCDHSILRWPCLHRLGRRKGPDARILQLLYCF